MYELKKNGKVFRSKSVGTGPSSYEKRIYRAAVSQTLRNTGLYRGSPTFLLDKGPHTFLWVVSRASSEQITIGVLNCLNYCKIYVTYA